MPWKKLNETPYRAGYRKMLKRHFLLPDGREAEYDIVDDRCSVAVFSLTPDNQVLLVKQYRPGPEKYLLELPGGFVDGDETTEDAAHRELLEETGFTGDFRFVGSTYKCANSTCIRNYFAATNCTKIQEPSLDENEFIEFMQMPLTEFRARLREGERTDSAGAYFALDALGLL